MIDWLQGMGMSWLFLEGTGSLPSQIAYFQHMKSPPKTGYSIEFWLNFGLMHNWGLILSFD